MTPFLRKIENMSFFDHFNLLIFDLSDVELFFFEFFQTSPISQRLSCNMTSPILTTQESFFFDRQKQKKNPQGLLSLFQLQQLFLTEVGIILSFNGTSNSNCYCRPALSNPFATRHMWRMASFCNNSKMQCFEQN